ncbi:hypothetical protein Tco_0008869 [Tanacetum coccineum]
MNSCNRKGVAEIQSQEWGVVKKSHGMLRINLCEAGTNEEIFTFVVWIRAFNINEPIYSELFHEFYSTYKFHEVCANDELKTKKIIKFRLGGRAHSLALLEFARRLGLYHSEELDEDVLYVLFRMFAQNPVLRVLHKMITYGLCQMTTGHFITKLARKARVLSDEQDVLRDAILRPPRASMQDLYARMGSMEIRQGAIERMAYRQSYQWDRYARVFEHKAKVYNVLLQGAYNPPRYAQS